jgi:hypothetical protein
MLVKMDVRSSSKFAGCMVVYITTKYGLVESESGFVHAKAVFCHWVVCFIAHRKSRYRGQGN